MWNLNSGPIFCNLLTVLLLTACQPTRPEQDMVAQAAQTATSPDDQAEPIPAAPSTLLAMQPATAG